MAKICTFEGVENELLGGFFSSISKALSNLSPQKQLKSFVSNSANAFVKTLNPNTYIKNPLGVANAVLNPMTAVKTTALALTDPAASAVQIINPIATVKTSTGGKTKAQRQEESQAATAQNAIQDVGFATAVQNAGYNVNQLSQSDLAALYSAYLAQNKSSGVSINKKYVFFGLAGLALVIYLARR